MAGIKDVAAEAGLSVATVSRVLNGHPSVSEDARRRVTAAVERLGYRPNAVARSLRTDQTRTLVLTSHDQVFLNNVVEETIILRDRTLRYFEGTPRAFEVDERKRRKALSHHSDSKSCSERKWNGGYGEGTRPKSSLKWLEVSSSSCSGSAAAFLAATASHASARRARYLSGRKI